jgi:hypothetical protein
MKLEINQKIVAENADAEAIKDALRVLNQENEAFITLWESEDIFLQAAGVPQTGYMMSYHNGQTGEELISKNQAIKPQTVMRAMSSYARGNWDWRNMIGWQPTGEYAARIVSRGSALRCGLPIYVALLFFIVAIAPLVIGTKWVAEQAVFKGLCEQNGDGKFAHYEHGGGDDITVSYSPPRCWFDSGKNIDFHTVAGSNADVIDAAARAVEVVVPVIVIVVIEIVGLLLWWRARKHRKS